MKRPYALAILFAAIAGVGLISAALGTDIWGKISIVRRSNTTK